MTKLYLFIFFVFNILLSPIYLKAQSFQDVAATNGINVGFGATIGFGGGVSFCDFNGDGLDDLTFTSTDGLPPYFYANNGSGFDLLTPIITETATSKQALWVDFDNDGDKDFYITHLNAPNRLYENDGNFVFTDVTATVGLPVINDPTYGAVFGDYDNDGHLDLYVTNQSAGSPFTNYLYHNNGDATFTDVTSFSGTADAPNIPFCAVFFDYNKDGFQDLYIANDRQFSNTMFKNNGDGTFSDVSAATGTDIIIDAMNVGVADYNNNGELDIYVTNTPGGHALLQNNGDETFTDVATAAGVVANQIGWAGSFFDMDNDRDLDLYVSSSGTEPNNLFRNLGNGTFDEPFPTGLPGDNLASFGNAIGDFNNDGKPDIAVSNNRNGDTHQLWENQTSNSNNYLKISLEGTKSNRDGVGSWIEVYTDGQKQIRYTHAGSNFLTQNSTTEIFGLENYTTVDSIKVRWLSGIVDRLENVSANQILHITEGATYPFKDVTNQHAVTGGYGYGFVGGGVSFIDFTGDGMDDLSLATTTGEHPKFYQNNNGTFVEIPNLIFNPTEQKQILWVDYDNDGDKDLFIANFDSQNKLYQNDGSLNMTDVTGTCGLANIDDPSMGASFGDYDNDGNLDLYVVNHDLFSNYRNYLYHNNGDGTFTDVTVSSGTEDFGKLALCTTFLDYDKDGWQDIYIAIDRTNFANTLLKNNGDGTFSDVSVASGTDISIDAMNVGIADYNDDGFLDIYVTNTPTGGNNLLTNNGNGSFSENAGSLGVGFYRVGWGANWLDYDNDTDLDLYVSSMNPTPTQPNALYRQESSGTFIEPFPTGMVGDTCKSYANAVGDIDNDGLIDIAVCNSDGFPFKIYKNQSTANNNWLKIKLEGVTSNRDGIGSWLEIHDNGKILTRYTHCGEAYLGQNSSNTHFGLGDDSSVDAIYVRWLSGEVDMLTDVSVNQVLTITEGSFAVLPVTLSDFSAIPLEKSIQLEWTIEESANFAGFELQRSTDGREFHKSTFVPFENNQKKYNFEDKNVTADILYYYRLKNIDTDGSFEFSEIKSAQIESSGTTLITNIYPNPIKNGDLNIRLSKSATNEELIFELYNVGGKIVQKKYISSLDASQTVQFSMQNVLEGVYWLQVSTGSQSEVFKVVKM